MNRSTITCAKFKAAQYCGQCNETFYALVSVKKPYSAVALRCTVCGVCFDKIIGLPENSMFRSILNHYKSFHRDTIVGHQ